MKTLFRKYKKTRQITALGERIIDAIASTKETIISLTLVKLQARIASAVGKFQLT